jgi:ATP adenylyltransferase
MDLRARIQQQSARALASGQLQPTLTDDHSVDDGEVRFSVRVIRGLDRKKRSRAEQARTGLDPFLPPYDDDLFVADLSKTHVALLNKYPVLPEHLLVVTRADEPQQSWLTAADFEALWQCMQQVDWLGFYNSGPLAGASQPHKHLQLAPVGFSTLSLFTGDDAGFAFCQVSLETATGGGDLARFYRDSMDALRLDADQDPYNLLVTRDRMIVVPRARESWEGVSLNAMGFAGSFLVRSDDVLERLRAVGPIQVLAGVARPA